MHAAPSVNANFTEALAAAAVEDCGSKLQTEAFSAPSVGIHTHNVSLSRRIDSSSLNYG